MNLMKAKNIISPIIKENDYQQSPMISSDSHLPELSALSFYVMPGEECAFLYAECNSTDYSASIVARAVEDADAHLLGLWTCRTDDGKMRMTLNVGRSDPMPVALSLRRYDYDVTDWYLPAEKGFQLSEKAIDALRLFLKV